MLGRNNMSEKFPYVGRADLERDPRIKEFLGF